LRRLNGINELLLEFTPFPGPFLFGFLKANIIFGFARNEKTDPVTLVDTITYYDGGLTGTICPPAGCASVNTVPGPVAGARIAGSDLGERWPSRLVATAAEASLARGLL
jgi:hypothetical protein